MQGAPRGGKQDLSYEFATTQLGLVVFACSEEGVHSILFGDSEEELLAALSRELPGTRLVRGGSVCEAWRPSVESVVNGDETVDPPSLVVRGTDFQRRVWSALREIPEGQTASYSEVAESIGAPRAARAVARACASNRIAVAVPCHRVVRGDGSLGGFKWELDLKRRLLERERQHPDRATP